MNKERSSSLGGTRAYIPLTCGNGSNAQVRNRVGPGLVRILALVWPWVEASWSAGCARPTCPCSVENLWTLFARALGCRPGSAAGPCSAAHAVADGWCRLVPDGSFPCRYVDEVDPEAMIY
jgi:hypothetical protein